MKGYMFIILNYSIIILNLNRLVYHHTVLPQVIHSHINFAELQLSKYFANDYFENSRFAIRKPIPKVYRDASQSCQQILRWLQISWKCLLPIHFCTEASEKNVWNQDISRRLASLSILLSWLGIEFATK